jgi:hypothetical protein
MTAGSFLVQYLPGFAGSWCILAESGFPKGRERTKTNRLMVAPQLYSNGAFFLKYARKFPVYYTRFNLCEDFYGTFGRSKPEQPVPDG